MTEHMDNPQSATGNDDKRQDQKEQQEQPNLAVSEASEGQNNEIGPEAGKDKAKKGSSGETVNSQKNSPDSTKFENQATDKEAIASANRKPFFKLRLERRERHSEFLQYVEDCEYFETPFWIQLQAIAALSIGFGLEAQKRPIIGIAQRSPTLHAALALASKIQERDDADLQLIEVENDQSAGKSPEALAHYLIGQVQAGNLRGELIALLLPPEEISQDWQQICQPDAKSPLIDFLRESGKRLIISFELASNQSLSRLVNGRTGILPLSWGTPLLAHLVDGVFNLQTLDPQLVADIEQAGHWCSASDDSQEKTRFIQFSSLNRRYQSPEELISKIRELLAVEMVQLDRLWQESENLVDQTFGLVPDRQKGEQERGEARRAPLQLKRMLLCTIAFAPDLPSAYFKSILMTLLPLGQPVEFSDLPKERQKAIQDEAKWQGNEHPVLPPMPSLAHYLDEHFDRVCQGHQIEVNEKGLMQLGRSWHDFPLNNVICRRAPSAALDFTSRLLDNLDVLLQLKRYNADLAIRILANLWHSLAASIGDARVMEGLIRLCDLEFSHGFAQNRGGLIEALFDREQYVAMQLSDRLSSTGSLLELSLRVADILVLFLVELRKIVAMDNGTDSLEEDTRRFFNLVLERSIHQPFRVSMFLSVVIMDKDQPLADYDFTAEVIQSAFTAETAKDMTAIVRQTVTEIILLFCGSQADEGAAYARRILAYFHRQSLLPGRTRIWRELYQMILLHFINFDVRWPPPSRTLLPYHLHKRYLSFDQVLLEEMAQPQTAHEGNRLADFIIDDFLALTPSDILANDPADFLKHEAGHRLLDVINILLDGVPVDQDGLSRQDWKETQTILLGELCAACGVERYDTFEGLNALFDRWNPQDGIGPIDRSNQKLYGLFWPAILLHWRLMAFGIDGISQDSEQGRHFHVLIQQICDRLTKERLIEMADGMKILADTIRQSLLWRTNKALDPASWHFYEAKQKAADRLMKFLRKRALAK